MSGLAGAGSIPPLATNTPNNHGGAVIAPTYALLVVTIIFSAIRVATTFTLRRAWGGDDILLIIAVCVALAQSIIVEKAAYYGTGKHFNSLNSHHQELYFKFTFAANILWLVAQALAKSCTIFLMSRLSTRKSRMKTIVYPTAHGIVGLWFVFSILALSLQCDSPRWEYRPSRCAGEGALWYPVIILNIITDIMVSFLFAPTVMKLQMNLHQKLTVSGLFGFRLIVCVFSIAQLAVLAGALRAQDTTWRMVTPVVLGQCVMNLSILAAAAPSLHRFLNELHSGGGFGMGMTSSQYELSYGSKERSGKNRTTKKSKSKSRLRSGNQSKNRVAMDSTDQYTDTNQTLEDGRKVTDFRPDIAERNHNAVSSDPHRLETSSRSSGQGSEDMIIRQTKAWTVTSYDDHNNDGRHNLPMQKF